MLQVKNISKTVYFAFYLLMPEDICNIILYLPRVFLTWISIASYVSSQNSPFSSGGEQIALCVYVYVAIVVTIVWPHQLKSFVGGGRTAKT